MDLSGLQVRPGKGQGRMCVFKGALWYSDKNAGILGLRQVITCV